MSDQSRAEMADTSGALLLRALLRHAGHPYAEVEFLHSRHVWASLARPQVAADGAILSAPMVTGSGHNDHDAVHQLIMNLDRGGVFANYGTRVDFGLKLSGTPVAQLATRVFDQLPPSERVAGWIDWLVTDRDLAMAYALALWLLAVRHREHGEERTRAEALWSDLWSRVLGAHAAKS